MTTIETQQTDASVWLKGVEWDDLNIDDFEFSNVPTTITNWKLQEIINATPDNTGLELYVTELTPEQALMIAQRPYLATIYIKGLNTIDTPTAINLANTRVKELYLDDITYLSEEQVKWVSNRMGTKWWLAYYGGNVLSLDGLTKVDDGVFKALLEAKCMSCRVRNLVLTPNQKAMYNQARKEAQKAGGAVPLVLNYELNSIVV